MFTLEPFLSNPISRAQPLGRRSHRVLRDLLTAKPHRFLPPSVRELRIPGDAEARPLIDETIADVEAVAGDAGLRALYATVERPALRVAGRLAADGAREYMVAATVAADDAGPAAAVFLSVRVLQRDAQARLLGMSCRLIPVSEVERIRDELRAAYRSAEGRRALVLPERAAVLWLRGQGVLDLPRDWQGELEGLAATYGFRMDVLRDANVDPRTTQQRLRRLAPRAVLLWDHDGRGLQLAARAGLGRVVAVERLEGSWEDVVHDVANVLARLAGQPPMLELPPRSVLEAVVHARPDERVVVLPSALASARDSVFRRPADVRIAIEAIVDAVKAGALDAPGGLAAALEGAPFRYASGVSKTARTKHRSAYERAYEGRTIMLGPHLKLGAGSPEHCLRIYWWVDDAVRRVVIGHVGEHLPDAG